MTDPTLTDEELAALDKRLWGGPIELSHGELSRLIAALRASRAEVEELRTSLDKHFHA